MRTRRAVLPLVWVIHFTKERRPCAFQLRNADEDSCATRCRSSSPSGAHHAIGPKSRLAAPMITGSAGLRHPGVAIFIIARLARPGAGRQLRGARAPGPSRTILPALSLGALIFQGFLKASATCRAALDQLLSTGAFEHRRRRAVRHRPGLTLGALRKPSGRRRSSSATPWLVLLFYAMFLLPSRSGLGRSPSPHRPGLRRHRPGAAGRGQCLGDRACGGAALDPRAREIGRSARLYPPPDDVDDHPAAGVQRTCCRPG